MLNFHGRFPNRICTEMVEDGRLCYVDTPIYDFMQNGFLCTGRLRNSLQDTRIHMYLF